MKVQHALVTPRYHPTRNESAIDDGLRYRKRREIPKTTSTMMQFMLDEIQILCVGFTSTLEGKAFENTFHKNEDTEIYRFSVEWTDLPSFRESSI